MSIIDDDARRQTGLSEAGGRTYFELLFHFIFLLLPFFLDFFVLLQSLLFPLPLFFKVSIVGALAALTENKWVKYVYIYIFF